MITVSTQSQSSEAVISTRVSHSLWSTVNTVSVHNKIAQTAQFSCKLKKRSAVARANTAKMFNWPGSTATVAVFEFYNNAAAVSSQ